MRRKDREITDFNEQLAIIKRCDSCVLALHDEDFPYVVPVSFGMAVEEGTLYLYFHCASQGKKLELLQRDNRATFEMDCDHALLLNQEKMSCTTSYSSVIGHGLITAGCRITSRPAARRCSTARAM